MQIYMIVFTEIQSFVATVSAKLANVNLVSLLDVNNRNEQIKKILTEETLDTLKAYLYPIKTEDTNTRSVLLFTILGLYYHYNTVSPIYTVCSNFGRYGYLYKKTYKKTVKKRTSQGNGACFNSAMQVIIVNRDFEDRPRNIDALLDIATDKIYKIKCFCNGNVQIPGILRPDLSDGREVLDIFYKRLRKILFNDTIVVESYHPILINFKFKLIRETRQGESIFIDCLSQRTLETLLIIIKENALHSVGVYIRHNIDSSNWPEPPYKDDNYCSNHKYYIITDIINAVSHLNVSFRIMTFIDDADYDSYLREIKLKRCEYTTKVKRKRYLVKIFSKCNVNVNGPNNWGIAYIAKQFLEYICNIPGNEERLFPEINFDSYQFIHDDIYSDSSSLEDES